MKRLPETLPAVVATLIGARYVWGVAAGPHFFDAGELVAASWELGGSHPPGQALYSVVAHAFCLLPIGPIPARVALLSALCVVAAGLLTARATRLVCRHLRHDAVAPWAAAAAAGMLMWTPPVGRQANRAEVYALALALTAWAVLELLRFAVYDDRGALLRAALAAGLVASVHPPHALATVAIGGVLALWDRRGVFRNPRLLGAAAGCTLLAIAAMIAYLPLRAAAGAAMWGDPRSLHGLLRYLGGTAYRGNFVSSPVDYALAVVAYARHATLMLAVIPPIALLWHATRASSAGRMAARLLTAAIAALLVVVMQPLQDHIPDIVAYLGPALIVLSVGGAATLGHFIRGRTRHLASAGLMLSASGPAMWIGPANYLSADQPVLETLGNALIEAPAPRSLVVTTTDFAAATWIMARAVDGARPDTAHFVSGLSTSSWQWHQLAPHPALSGQPRRGPGAGAKQAYLAGLLSEALPRIPVALEQDPPVPRLGSVAGPYLMLAPSTARADEEPRVDLGNIAERLARRIPDDAALGPPSDHDAAGAILRHYELTRVGRLLVAGRTDLGIASMLRAIPRAPRALRSAISEVSSSLVRPRPHTVREPGAFLLTVGDAERAVATHLWALGRTDLAHRLMAWQSVRDPRALLQEAYFARLEGDVENMKRSIATFSVLAPEWSREAAALYALEP